MTREEGVKLVHDAIEAGIVNDLGSGSNVDVMVITKGKHEMFRNTDTSHYDRKYRRPGGFKYPRGTTAVIKEKVTMTTVKETVLEKMDTSD